MTFFLLLKSNRSAVWEGNGTTIQELDYDIILI